MVRYNMVWCSLVVIFFEQFQFTLWEISSTALHFGAILNHIYIYIYSSILRWIQLSCRDKDDYFISLRSLEYLLKRGKRIGTILFELVIYGGFIEYAFCFSSTCSILVEALFRWRQYQVVDSNYLVDFRNRILTRLATLQRAYGFNISW